MDLDAAAAVSIGLYQMYDHAISGEVTSISKKYIYLSILASILWLSYQYRKGANFSAVYTGLGLLLNLYLLHLKGKNDKKE
jgi:lipid-A-disaccharide synthase-like uncharacterized protein